jgi:lambda family phage minor tail protein L
MFFSIQEGGYLMPIDAHDDFKKQKNKSTNAPIYLYTLYKYDGANNLYLAEWSEDITFNGQVYVAFPITHDDIGENSQNQTDEIRITVGNVSRLIGSYLIDYEGLIGIKVKITIVWLNKLDNPDSKVEWTYYVDNTKSNERDVSFILRPKVNALSIVLPARTYSRNYCQWKFKSYECGYAGEATTCNRTKQRCKELGNYKRFGGFPSTPSRQMIIV